MHKEKTMHKEIYEKVPTSLNFVEREKATRKFWEENSIFEKSISLRDAGENFTFYDGPPTANGKPHIGHVLTRVIKDMIPRYQTMKGKRVLLCEDNEMNSQIAMRVLEKKGMLVEWAPDGQAGFDKFNNSDEGYYDVVLMDVRMPVMDGLEATRVIRNLERMDSKKVPIIAMSANTNKKDVIC